MKWAQVFDGRVVERFFDMDERPADIPHKRITFVPLEEAPPAPDDIRSAARRAEYPPLHEQLEAITEHARGRPEKMIEIMDRIDAVKARYPKP